jgi:hypothetical protein
MRLGGPLCQGLPGLPLESPLGRCPFGLNLLQFQAVSPLTRDDDEVDSRRQELSGQPKALPAEPLDSVAGDGTAGSPGHHEAKATGGQAWLGRHLCEDQNEMRGGDPLAGRLNSLEFGSLADATSAAETKFNPVPFELPGGHDSSRPALPGRLLLVDAHAEALATLATSIE